MLEKKSPNIGQREAVFDLKHTYGCCPVDPTTRNNDFKHRLCCAVDKYKFSYDQFLRCCPPPSILMILRLHVNFLKKIKTKILIQTSLNNIESILSAVITIYDLKKYLS